MVQVCNSSSSKITTKFHLMRLNRQLIRTSSSKVHSSHSLTCSHQSNLKHKSSRSSNNRLKLSLLSSMFRDA